MEKQELTQLTSIEDLTAAYHEVLGDRIHTDGTHTLHTKGVLDGMEVMIVALSKSIGRRKKLTGDETVSDK